MSPPPDQPPRSPGEEKLIEGIKEVVQEVTKPRFDGMDSRFDSLDKRVSGLDAQFNGLRKDMDEQFRSVRADLKEAVATILKFLGSLPKSS
jgi:hypothetical protein